MIVDTSAIMAILLKEDDAEIFLQALTKGRPCSMSGVSFIELTIVADRKDNPIPAQLAEEFVRDARISVQPVTTAQIDWARFAHMQYGRGRHRARFNLGDCFAYALAKETGEPLLFKGADFAQTDIRPAIPLVP